MLTDIQGNAMSEQHSIMTSQAIMDSLQALQDREKAAQLQRFFKTGPGDYGEGDIFLGVTMPHLHGIARKAARSITLEELSQVVSSEVHEARMTGLLTLVHTVGSKRGRFSLEQCVAFYLQHIDQVNNWDLVDVTCPKILGPWFLTRDKGQLFAFARSDNLWHQRIAIITTHYFIREGSYETTLQLADILINHPHDLIHKAVGWMLREIGNRTPLLEREYLRTRYMRMPRTMLRYAIEKFPEHERQAYLRGSV